MTKTLILWLEFYGLKLKDNKHEDLIGKEITSVKD